MLSKKLEIGLFLLGITLMGVGVYVWKLGVKPTKIEIVEAIQDTKMVFVDVSGEVEKPGVFGLVLGSRVGEAIASAGGITEKADLDWISKNLNQAKILVDGEKIYIPKFNSNLPILNSNSSTIDQFTISKININTASESELDKLPGVGPVTAGKIINGRPYANTEELKSRKIVTDKVWEQIKDLISAW